MFVSTLTWAKDWIARSARIPSIGNFCVFRDVFYQGTCDEGCQKLADSIGWGVSVVDP